MRIWMLASLLYAVTAIGGYRPMEPSFRFFDRMIDFTAIRSVQRVLRNGARDCGLVSAPKRRAVDPSATTIDR